VYNGVRKRFSTYDSLYVANDIQDTAIVTLLKTNRNSYATLNDPLYSAQISKTCHYSTVNI